MRSPTCVAAVRGGGEEERWRGGEVAPGEGVNLKGHSQVILT